MTSVVFTIVMIYWILGWWNFGVWIKLLAYDMPLEGYIISQFGYTLALVGVVWWVMYIISLLFLIM